MNQLSLFFEENQDLISLREASEWASKYLERHVTVSNISYLLQYGRIKKYSEHGNALLSKTELKTYYDSSDKEQQWKQRLGKNLNWKLSFVEYKESERTKHVHRLHPYKGKFIPQLVEYFLDAHTDEFKKEIYFQKNDIVLDPFCGSGTTLVQANELGIHAIGIDISAFNAMISNAKVEQHHLPKLMEALQNITARLENFEITKNSLVFEEQLLSKLAQFNKTYFPSPEYKRKVRAGEIDEKEYSKKQEQAFIPIFDALLENYKIKTTQDRTHTFLDKWFLFPIREEIEYLFEEIKTIEDEAIQKILTIILSRAVRSCRATTHADLATLKAPVTSSYYCKKHGKICKPIFSMKSWWDRYSVDTVNRLKDFNKRRTATFQICLAGESRTSDIFDAVKKKNSEFAELLFKQKIKGIFSSPPYVGLINYHEQHAYSYEIFGFDRNDELEIDPLSKGQGREAKASYTKGIADTLQNCKKFLQNNYDIFLVANDKHNLYPNIAEMAAMQIVNQFERPVLNRVEKDRATAYSETIFHLKEK